jgi:hypothetical protein
VAFDPNGRLFLLKNKSSQMILNVVFYYIAVHIVNKKKDVKMIEVK